MFIHDEKTIILLAMGIAGPLGLKALALIAGKALIISKVALTIAGIIALKKLYSSDSHQDSSIQVHASENNRRNAYLNSLNSYKPIVASNGYDPYYYDNTMQAQPISQ